MRWRYKIRLQAEWAGYYLARGDLKPASSHAMASLQLAEGTLSRKHMAWAHKLLADIAALEERMDDARGYYETALRILEAYPCPVIE